MLKLIEHLAFWSRKENRECAEDGDATEAVASYSVESQQIDGDLREEYCRQITQEGYEPTIDGDGDIVFVAEGLTFVVWLDRNDPEFFHLYFRVFGRLRAPKNGVTQ